MQKQWDNFWEHCVGQGDNAMLGHNGPTEALEHEPIFKWDTLKDVAPHELQHARKPIPGKMYEIELANGTTVQVWRAEDGRHYFCHGLTFGGKEAPGGAISPYTGAPVETILRDYYRMIPEGQARAGDILVWRGVAPETTPHSAILTAPILAEGKSYLGYTTRIQTKNGLSPETAMTLEEVTEIYGEAYNVYRRR